MSEQLTKSARMLRRRWRIIVLVPLLALVVSLFVSLGSRKEYSATAQVLLDPVNQVDLLVNPASSVTRADPERQLNTAVSQITETPMANLVRSSLRLTQSSRAVLAQVSAAPEGTTNIIDISVRDRSPGRAAQIANAFAAQFVVFRLDNVRSAIQQAAALAQSRLAALPPAERSAATGVQLQGHLSVLQADAALVTSDAHVSQTASVPSSPVQPRPLFDAIVAAMVGLLVAIAAVIVLELLDPTVRDEEDASALTGLPSLGVIPKPPRRTVAQVIRRGRGRSRPRVKAGRLPGARSRAGKLVVSSPPTPDGRPPLLDWEQEESYGSLAVSLLSLKLAPEPVTVMITSPGPQDGKTSVTLGLAAALAELGQRVIAVEGDLRRPGFSARLGLPPSGKGLSTVLAGSTSARASLVSIHTATRRAAASRPSKRTRAANEATNGTRSADPSFMVLTSGTIPQKPHLALGSAELPRLMRHLQSMADIVLIDTPPLGLIKDAVIFGAMADRVLIVARLGHTGRDALRHCRAAVDQVDAALLGIVILGERRGALSPYAGKDGGAFIVRSAGPSREKAAPLSSRG